MRLQKYRSLEAPTPTTRVHLPTWGRDFGGLRGGGSGRPGFAALHMVMFIHNRKLKDAHRAPP